MPVVRVVYPRRNPVAQGLVFGPDHGVQILLDLEHRLAEIGPALRQQIGVRVRIRDFGL